MTLQDLIRKKHADYFTIDPTGLNLRLNEDGYQHGFSTASLKAKVSIDIWPQGWKLAMLSAKNSYKIFVNWTPCEPKMQNLPFFTKG